MPSNREDLSGNVKMNSSGILTPALGDCNTSGGAVTINCGDGSMVLGGPITSSSGFGTSTSLESMAVWRSNAGTAGVLGDSLLNTGTARVGNSGALDIKSGSSTSGSGISIAISVGSGTDIGGAFSVTAGKSGAAGGDASFISQSSLTSSSGA